MQDWNGCSSLEQDNGSNGDRISIILTDKRDSNEYTVAKLKDGKCWMTQNLRLIGPKTLTSADSDTTQPFDLSADNLSGFRTSANGGSSNAYNYNYAYLNPKYGGYYTWYAATASEGTKDKAATRDYQTSNSICPKGWKIPSKLDADALASNYSGTNPMRSPINFALSGWLLTDNLTDNEARTWLWLSTGSGNVFSPTNSAYPYLIYYQAGSNAISVSTGTPHGSGLPIRCVVRN